MSPTPGTTGSRVFDADGNFIRTWGKAGDGPGYFARPKGIAIDGDGHVWVADGMQDRVQVFSPEGQLLIWMGGHGSYPGQFKRLAGITIDKNNRVFTTGTVCGPGADVPLHDRMRKRSPKKDSVRITEQKKAGGRTSLQKQVR